MSDMTLQLAKSKIVKAFNGLASSVLRHNEIRGLFKDNREDWQLESSMSLGEFLDFVLAHTDLHRIDFGFPHRKEVRYTWGEVSLYEIVLTLGSGCYLSHYTAVYLHELTEQIPKTIYVNREQSPKPPPGNTLTQQTLDTAFQRKQRVTSNITTYGDYKICLLNGKHTGDLAVSEISADWGDSLRVTNIERTLIDITVRPSYAGGVFEVLKAYRLAHDRVSVNKLAAILKKLDYVYPYHQAIGFYMERSGVYKESQLQLLEKNAMEFDFYLTHAMKKTEHSSRWRLFFPEGM